VSNQSNHLRAVRERQLQRKPCGCRVTLATAVPTNYSAGTQGRKAFKVCIQYNCWQCVCCQKCCCLLLTAATTASTWSINSAVSLEHSQVADEDKNDENAVQTHVNVADLFRKPELAYGYASHIENHDKC